MANQQAQHELPGVTPEAPGAAELPLTPLATLLQTQTPAALTALSGVRTLSDFGDARKELLALRDAVGFYDLGFRGWIEVRGEDRTRWLNGMVTNNVAALAEGEGNYSFLLNAQGRIQGDGIVFRTPECLLLQTGGDQVARLLAHLDQFIIMDDVELRDATAESTGLGLAGPGVPELLARLGVPELLARLGVPLPSPTNATTPAAPSAGSSVIADQRVCGVPARLIHTAGGAASRVELWFAPGQLPTLCEVLLAAGVIPCGMAALDALRVLEAIPLFGVDFNDRDLPQEVNQPRALNFSKGCYLGQEIVERIRSRGQVHRRLSPFQLTAAPASLPAELRSGDRAAGRITSTATVDGNIFALGIARTEALEAAGTSGSAAPALTLDEGEATPLRQPPLATLARI